MGNSAPYFLKISGFVTPAKRKEFEQTFRFISKQLSPDCLQFSLAADILFADEYHFYSLWPTAESLGAFCKSQEFLVLEGAFQTLGSLEQDIRGKQIDMKSFELLAKA